MFDLLSLIIGLALAAGTTAGTTADPTPKPMPPAAVMPECNELFRGHRTVYADDNFGRHFICVDGVWVEQDRSIQPKPRPP